MLEAPEKFQRAPDVDVEFKVKQYGRNIKKTKVNREIKVMENEGCEYPMAGVKTKRIGHTGC